MSTLLKELRKEGRTDIITLSESWLEQSRINYRILTETESHRIFPLRAIKRVCLEYRLRFLPVHFFKSDIPEEAFIEIEKLKQCYGISLETLMIMAPSALFSLEHREKDPLLFARLSENSYLLIHQWGKELNGSRKIQSLPLRNPLTMALSIGLLALLFSGLLLPFTGGSETGIKEFLFGFGIVWMGFISYAVFLVFSQNVFPTSVIWNSKFLD